MHDNEEKTKVKNHINETVKVFGADIPKYRACPECGKPFSCEFNYDLYKGYSPRCDDCQDIYLKKMKEARKNVAYFNIGSGMVDITAIGFDKKTGQEVGITKNGGRVPLEKTQYNKKNDPRGWKAIGKKYREKDEFGLKNNS